jgi:phosphomethylpyrimidine synthase
MCGPHFCSMKITQDVREYAAQKAIDEDLALTTGLKEKAGRIHDHGWRAV